MLASTELLLIRRPPECSWLPRRPGKFLKGEIFQNHRLLGCILWEISSTVERMQTITKAAQCENNSSLVMCFSNCCTLGKVGKGCLSRGVGLNVCGRVPNQPLPSPHEWTLLWPLLWALACWSISPQQTVGFWRAGTMWFSSWHPG